MKLTIYIFITIHTLCIERSIIGVIGAKRNYSKIKFITTVFFKEGKKLNKKSYKKYQKTTPQYSIFLQTKRLVLYKSSAKVLMAKPRNFLRRLKSPEKVIKHITTENIHKILWKVYCFELSSYCTPLPPPPPPKLAPDFEGQMANFPIEFLEHHSMLTDILDKELCKNFRAEFCTLTWNSLLLKMNLDGFFCVTEMASFVFQKS